MDRRLLMIVVLAVVGAPAYAQPSTPLDKLPADLPENVRLHVEKLYSEEPAVRLEGLRALSYWKPSRVVSGLMIEMLADEGQVPPDEGQTDEELTTVGWWAARFLSERFLSDTPHVREQLLDALRDVKPEVRMRAAYALPNDALSGNLEVLIKALDDPNAQVRKHVAEALGRRKSFAVEEALMGAVDDVDLDVRRAVAKALYRQESPAALDALVKMMRDTDPETRLMAAEAVGALIHRHSGCFAWSDSAAHRRYYEPLTELLSDRDVRVRRAAAAAFGNARERPQDALRMALNDADKQVRLNAAEAIWVEGFDEGILDLLGDEDPQVRCKVAELLDGTEHPEAIKALARALGDEDEHVRLAAARSLENDDERRGDCLAGLAASDDPDVRREARSCLATNYPDRAVKLVADALAGNSEELKLEILSAELDGSDARITQLLLSATKDASLKVRIAAYMRLSGRNDAAVLEAITDALKNGDLELRRAIANDICAFDSEADPKPLIEALSDPDARVRAGVVGTLARLKKLTSPAPLIKMLNDPEQNVRATAAYALGSKFREAAQDQLANVILKDKSLHVRGQALAFISFPGTKSPLVLEALMASVNDDDADNRDCAVGILAGSHDPAAVEALLRALEDSSDRVRTTAAGAFAWIKDKRSVPLLRKCLECTSDEVRTAAGRALLYQEGSSPDLRAMLRDRDPAIRVSAVREIYMDRQNRAENLAEALAHFDPAVRQVAIEEVRERDVDVLARLLRSAEVPGRVSAARRLSFVSGTLAIAALKDENPHVRRAAALGVGQGAVGALDSVLELADDPDAIVRSAAATALCRLGEYMAEEHGATPDRVASALGRLLSDSDRGVYDAAAESLRRLGAGLPLSDEKLAAAPDYIRIRLLSGMTPGPAHLRCLEDENVDVRRAAAEIFSRLAERLDPDAHGWGYGDEEEDQNASREDVAGEVEALIGALDDPDPFVRCHAATALGHLHAGQAREHLEALRDDPFSTVRKAAIAALPKLEGGDAFAELLNALKDDAASVKISAAAKLQQLGDKRAARPLLDALTSLPDEEYSATRAIAGALLELADESLVPALLSSIQNDDVHRCQVAPVLGKIGGRAAVEPLLEMFRLLDAREEWHERDAIALALGEIGDKRALKPLLTAFEESDYSNSSLAGALGALGDPAAIEPLAKGLKLDESIAMALARIRDPRAVAAMIDAWSGGFRGYHIRRALSMLGEPYAIKVMVNALTTEHCEELSKILHSRQSIAEQDLKEAAESDNELLRERAKAVLRRFGDPDEAETLRVGFERSSKESRERFVRYWKVRNRDADLEFLFELLEHTDSNLRAVAAEKLGNIGDKRAVPHLIALLAKRYARGELEAIKSLGRIGDQRAIDALIEYLEPPDSSYGCSSAEALARIGGEKVVGPLRRVMTGDYDNMRLSALMGLKYSSLPEAPELAAPSLKSVDPDERRMAVEVVAAAGRKEDLGLLLPLLDDASAEVRARAVEAVAAVGEVRGFDLLLPLLKDDAPEVRFEVVEGLAEADAGRAFEVIAPLVGDLDAEVAEAAAWRLLSLGGDKAVPHLIAALGSKHGNVIVRAAIDLGYMQNMGAVEPLIAALADELPDVRLSAADSLGMLGDARATWPLLGLLGDTGTCDRGRVDFHAADALAKIGDTAAVAPLIDMVTRRGTEAARAISVLGTLGDRRAFETIVDALPDPDLRDSAVIALGDLGDQRAVPFLLPLLDSEDRYFLNALVTALGRLNDARALPALTDQLVKTAGKWRGRPEYAVLEKFSMPERIDAVGKLMDHESDTVRLEASWILADAEETAALPYLEKALKDTDPRIRAVGAGGLYRLDQDKPKQLALLTSLLTDEADKVRAEAAGVLLKCKPREAVQELIAALADTNANVRHDAAQALGMLHDTRAVEPLIALMQDESEEVVRQAAYALGQIGDSRAFEPLLHMLEFGCAFGAAQSLGDLGDLRAIPHLCRHRYAGAWISYALYQLGHERQKQLDNLRDGCRGRERRLWIGHALAQMRDPSTVPLLILCLDDLYDGARTEGVDALKELTGQDFGTDTWRWWQWWHKNKARVQENQ